MEGKVVTREVVLCKDCKHRAEYVEGREDDCTGFALDFPDSVCPFQCEDGWYSWRPSDEWFCPRGELKE